MANHNFIEALQCQNKPAEPPFWELEFHLWDKFATSAFLVGEAFIKLSPKEKETAIRQNAEIIATVAEQLHFSAITVPGGYWELAPGKSAFYWLPEEYREKQVQALLQTMDKSITLVVNTGGVMAIPESQDYVQFAINMFERPEEVKNRADQILQDAIKGIDMYRNLGIEVFLSASDIADNSGPFFPPEQFALFILPFLEKWSSYIKQSGGYSILHTDGNIDMYIDKIAATELNALQSIDPVAGMDLLKTKQHIGDTLCLCGNLDCSIVILENESVIYEKTRDLLKAMHKHKGFVLGMSNVLEYDTPKEKYMAVIAAYQDFIKSN
ncbi:uroporphyrinogen decarboxylase family protein [Bacteroidota bacterium]